MKKLLITLLALLCLAPAFGVAEDVTVILDYVPKDNMDILDDAPSVYYPIVCAGLSDEQIRAMEEENALPHGWENMPYEDFLIERRKLMAAKIKAAFEILKKAAT